MKCPYCHAKVAETVAKCPQCDWEFPVRPLRRGRQKFRLNRRISKQRGAWILLLSATVGVGLFARELGSGDPTPRWAARDHAGEGLSALLDGDYATARNELTVAIRKDPRFAEGHLSRALAWLGLGDLTEARADATRAIALFGEGELDPIAWKGKDLAETRGRVIAGRIECVARAAEERRRLDEADYGALVQILYDVFRNPACRGAELALARWTAEPAYPVVIHAMRLCPELWTCRQDR